MPPTNLFGLGYGVGPAGYGYPSVGSWLPSSFGSSLVAWWDGAYGGYSDAGTTPIADGVAGYRWVERSPSQRQFNQSTAGDRPIYRANALGGRPAYEFDNAGDIMIGPDILAGAAAISIFVVWSAAGGSGALSISKQGAFNDPTAEWCFKQGEASNKRGSHDFISLSVADYVDSDAVSLGGGPAAFCYAGVTWAASEEPKHYHNGVLVSAIAASNWPTRASMPTTTEPIRIGFTPNFSAGSGGKIAEIVLVSRVLTTQERASLHAYFRAKYWTKQVACDGDSLTAGADSGVATTNWRPYPTAMYASLTGGPLLYNFGVTGQTIANMASDAATQIDVLANLPTNVLCAWGGTNDLAGGATAAATYTAYVAYCQARHAAGWKVVAFTILPRSDVNISVARAAFNALVVAGWATFADALCDVAADTRIGDDGDELDATYYLTDLVHLNNTGAAIVAGLAATQVNSL